MPVEITRATRTVISLRHDDIVAVLRAAADYIEGRGEDGWALNAIMHAYDDGQAFHEIVLVADEWALEQESRDAD
jgi:hypothetical protein